MILPIPAIIIMSTSLPTSATKCFTAAVSSWPISWMPFINNPHYSNQKTLVLIGEAFFYFFVSSCRTVNLPVCTKKDMYSSIFRPLLIHIPATSITLFLSRQGHIWNDGFYHLINELIAFGKDNNISNDKT